MTGRAAWLAAAVLAASPSPAFADASRGWRNLGLVLNGTMPFGALSAEEQGEVAIAAREMRRREKTAGLSPRERCRLGNLTTATPSALEEAAIDLKCSQR